MDGQVRVVVTGTAWMGRGKGSVTSALETLVDGAENEILVASYAIGTGAGSLLDGLERAAERGRTVVVIVNRFARQPMDVRQRLGNLMQDRPWCRVLDFSSPDPEEDLHAKVVVVDRARALVGSANLSRHGLLINHELAVVIEGAPAAEVARTIDLLLENRRLVRPIPPPGLPPDWL